MEGCPSVMFVFVFVCECIFMFMCECVCAWVSTSWFLCRSSLKIWQISTRYTPVLLLVEHFLCGLYIFVVRYMTGHDGCVLTGSVSSSWHVSEFVLRVMTPLYRGKHVFFVSSTARWRVSQNESANYFCNSFLFHSLPHLSPIELSL